MKKGQTINHTCSPVHAVMGVNIYYRVRSQAVNWDRVMGCHFIVHTLHKNMNVDDCFVCGMCMTVID